ncbi:helix-turn-helix domain-containing protein [Streptomyces spectabilis]|uniref:XRE family transcriptional regulator n=1 Tax=Streptomyces spectabilis TaxID=68270 RepID=UPI0033F70E00
MFAATWLMKGAGMGRSEKPVDPAAGPVQRFAYALRELRREAGEVTYREMAQRVSYSVPTLSQAAAGEKLPSLQVALAYVKACGGDLVEWERRWHEADDELASRSAVQDAAMAPYRGLARFEAGDQSRFFGRERLTDELERAVRAHRVTAVFGPSGSGKSSLLRAGLIPRLQRPDDPLLRPAALRIFTPGPQPLRTHRRLLAPAAGPTDTWLVADQFEEVFTLCQDPEERARFLELLLTALDPGSRLRVVLGVRGTAWMNTKRGQPVGWSRSRTSPVGGFAFTGLS